MGWIDKVDMSLNLKPPSGTKRSCFAFKRNHRGTCKNIGTGDRTNAAQQLKKLIDRSCPSLVPSEAGKKRNGENVVKKEKVPIQNSITLYVTYESVWWIAFEKNPGHDGRIV